MSRQPREDSLVLSVVVPAHGRPDLLARCLESISDAGVESTEVLVIDDGSQRPLEQDLSARFPKVTFFRRERPGGFSKAANAGLAQAPGSLLLLLNSDTELRSGVLEALTAAFQDDPRLGIAGACLTFPDGRPQWSGAGEPTVLWLFVLASGLASALGRLSLYRRFRAPMGVEGGEVDWVSGAALALRREVWSELGPLDERFKFYCQDLDLCLRAKDSGWKVSIVPAFRVIHHHGASISGEGTGVGGQNLELLWTDLLRWARYRKGEGWFQAAARLIVLGGRLRLWLRRFRRRVTPHRVPPESGGGDLHLQQAIEAVEALRTDLDRSR